MKQESRRFDAWSRNWSGAEDTELKVEEVEVSIEESEEVFHLCVCMLSVSLYVYAVSFSCHPNTLWES